MNNTDAQKKAIHAKVGKGPSNKERSRMQSEIKSHAKTLPAEKKNQWHGNWN